MNITGQRFGKLVAVEFSRWYTCKSRNRYPIWKFVCDCGKTSEAMAADVKSGKTRSCGCSKIPHGDAYRGKEHPLYLVWRGMHRRCYNPNAKDYDRYGGRGIKILWTSYSDFKKDMEGGYRKGLLIERRDVNGHYSSENCTWASNKQQCRNKRNNREIECHGVIMCMTEWAEIFGIHPAAFRDRLKRGMSVDLALTTPIRGKTLSLSLTCRKAQ